MAKKIIALVLIGALMFSVSGVVFAMDSVEMTDIDRNQLIADMYFGDIDISDFKTENNESLIPFCMDGVHDAVYTEQRTVNNTIYGLEVYSDGSFITTEVTDVYVYTDSVNAYTTGTRDFTWNLPHSAKMGIRVLWNRNLDTNDLTITSASSCNTVPKTVVIGLDTINVAPGSTFRPSVAHAYREFGIHITNAYTMDVSSSYGQYSVTVVNNEFKY